MSDTVISVENLSKLYRIGSKAERKDTLFAHAADLVKAPFRNFQNLAKLNTYRANGYEEADDLLWALRDVSFDVKQGEVLGIIGRNGAGKSTLLKILSRVAEPTRGRIRMKGRVSALLEVGTGFHPELTGRENVYLNGTILGMSKREIDAKFDAMVDFSGVEKFLDTPVKRYSSGMRVRLAFAVAAHLDPQILIVDEVLAVGDVEFQKKCLGKMQDVARGEGRTILFVSHTMAAVQSLCTRCIWLSGGRAIVDGQTDDVITDYLSKQRSERVGDLGHRTDRGGNGALRLQSVETAIGDDTDSEVLMTGYPALFKFKFDGPVKNTICSFTVYNAQGQAITCLSSKHLSVHDKEHEGLEPNAIVCRVNPLLLSPGAYSLNIAAERNGVVLDHVAEAFTFTVESGTINGRPVHASGGFGNVAMPHEWVFPSA